MAKTGTIPAWSVSFREELIIIKSKCIPEKPNKTGLFGIGIGFFVVKKFPDRSASVSVV
jgi:hypothetical protein